MARAKYPMPGLRQLERTYSWMRGRPWFEGRTNSTPERVMEAVRLRKAGLTLKEISQAMGRRENEEEPITFDQVCKLLGKAKKDSEAYRNHLRRKRYRANKEREEQP